jgi:hypothetical protein
MAQFLLQFNSVSLSLEFVQEWHFDDIQPVA